MKAPSSRLLRLELLTPANLGSAFGEATLDRPTQREIWTGLPFLPDSGLKGALAGWRYGDVGGEKENRERESRFGSPDRSGTDGRLESFGRPGAFVLGNGDLLAFPLPAGEGEVAWVFPVVTVARCARYLPPPAAERAGLLELLRNVEGEKARYVAWAEEGRAAPEAVQRAVWTPVAGGSVVRASASALAFLRRLAGPRVPAPGVWLLASSAGAAQLARQAADYRSSTALVPGQKTARTGALRRIELLPPGCVFVSLVTSALAPGEEPDLAAPIQIGSGENAGLGWVRWSEIDENGKAPETPPAALAPRGGRPLDEGVVLGQAYEDIGRLNEVEKGSALRAAIRSVVQGFGARAAFSGLPAALAFHAAKAKPAQEEPGMEARAHRWLLAALREPAPDPPAAKGKDETLLAWLKVEPFAPAALAARRDEVQMRWLALRRAVELALETEAKPSEISEGKTSA